MTESCDKNREECYDEGPRSSVGASVAVVLVALAARDDLHVDLVIVDVVIRVADPDLLAPAVHPALLPF